MKHPLDSCFRAPCLQTGLDRFVDRLFFIDQVKTWFPEFYRKLSNVRQGVSNRFKKGMAPEEHSGAMFTLTRFHFCRRWH
jgi:hypothetical protein